jgi:hypothetical protein
MTDYNATYCGRVANGLSQLGNAIAGGNPDISISARIGSMNDQNWFWHICRVIVDFTFYPIDGYGHCLGAYEADKNEDYKIGQGWIPGLVIMTCLMVVICTVVSPFTWLYFGISKMRKNAA